MPIDETIALILFLITFIFLIMGSVSMYKTLKSKSSVFLMIGIIFIPISIIASVIFERIVLSEYDSLSVYINYIYAYQETLLPAIILFLFGLGFYGVSKNIKNQSNKANSADAKSRAVD